MTLRRVLRGDQHDSKKGAETQNSRGKLSPLSRCPCA